MGQHERLYKIRHLLDAGRCVTPAQLHTLLEVSRSTINRDIHALRHRMNAPIEWNLADFKRHCTCASPSRRAAGFCHPYRARRIGLHWPQ
ncbi:HTH domain-containing protein [Ideonella sp. 4Y11]|uniref:HTH domain-containing protein n=1 Tax=Ideonella aquatica TaxID=2824119 RepID=A0A940YNW9_9BURK|nr:HTH domain-containing protein [Ideonella aquatica]MBQ0959806.1 HTH domain-containing protein [Ideonella aquatica]